MPSEPRADAFTVTGGAQLGWINASWPFGTLSVSPRSLTISSPFSRSYVFEPEQVVALEPCGWIPFLHNGGRQPVYGGMAGVETAGQLRPAAQAFNQARIHLAG